MRRFSLVLLLMACCAVGFAQAAGTKQPPQDSGFMSWIHDAWKTVQEQGRPAAEHFVRQFPQRFQSLKQQVADLSKKTHDKIAEMDLEQKRDLAIELWRVRKSLDLLTLLKPEVLHSLTGLDTSGLAALETQAQRTYAIVNAALKR